MGILLASFGKKGSTELLAWLISMTLVLVLAGLFLSALANSHSGDYAKRVAAERTAHTIINALHLSPHDATLKDALTPDTYGLAVAKDSVSVYPLTAERTRVARIRQFIPGDSLTVAESTHEPAEGEELSLSFVRKGDEIMVMESLEDAHGTALLSCPPAEGHQGFTPLFISDLLSSADVIAGDHDILQALEHSNAAIILAQGAYRDAGLAPLTIYTSSAPDDEDGYALGCLMHNALANDPVLFGEQDEGSSIPFTSLALRKTGQYPILTESPKPTVLIIAGNANLPQTLNPAQDGKRMLRLQQLLQEGTT